LVPGLQSGVKGLVVLLDAIQVGACLFTLPVPSS
jgi:hypothetical protein